MDQFYYEAGYIDESYFVYTAEAEISLEPYIVEGYIDPGYYVTQESFYTLTAELELLVGVTVEASGTWSSEFTVSADANIVKTTDVDISSAISLSADVDRLIAPNEANAILTASAIIDITAGVIRSADVAMQSNFSQTALGQRTSDIDLFAFSDAALTVSALVIRDNNITASAVFNVAIDFIRTRSVSSDDNAVFTFDVINQRSRDFNIETQAAFSLTADVDVFIGTIQSLTAVSSLSATISIPVKGGAANLVSSSSLDTSPKAGSLRPWNVTAGGFSENTYGTGIIESINSNSDSVYRTLKGNSWFFETYFNFDSYSNPTVDRTILTLGPLTVKQLANKSIQISIVDSTGTTRTRTSNPDIANGRVENLSTGRDYYFAMYNLGTEANSFNAYWSSFSPVSGVWTVYQLTSIRGVGYFDWSTSSNNKLKFYNPTGWVPRIKEVNYRIGNNVTYGLSSANTTISYPTENRTNEPGVTQVLLHFNNNGDDDTGIVVEVSAELSSRATLAFNGGIKIDGAADLASASAVSVSADIAILFDIALSSQASVSATTDLIVGAVINTASQFNQSTDASISRPLSADLESAVNVTVDANRTRDNSLAIESQFAQTVDLSAVRSASSDIASEITLTANLVKTVDAVITTEAIASELAIVSKIGNTLVTIETVASVSVAPIVNASGTSNLSSAASVNAVVNEINSISAILQSNTEVSLNANRLRDFISVINSNFALDINSDVVFSESITLETSFFTLGAAAQRLRGIDTDLVAQFEIITNAQSQQLGRADIASEFSQSAAATITAGLSAELVSESILNCTISHIEGADLVAFTNASLTVITEVGLFGQANIASEFTQEIQFTKIVQGQSDIDCVVSINNEARVTRSLASDINLVSTQVSAVNRVVNPGSELSTVSSLACIISHIEGADLEAFTNAALNVNSIILRGGIINTESNADLSATGLKVRLFQVAVTANSALSAEATTVIQLESLVDSNFALLAELSIIKELTANIDSAMTFIAAVREIDADSINQNVWIITRENWAYTISSDNREYTISNEDRNYLIRR